MPKKKNPNKTLNELEGDLASRFMEELVLFIQEITQEDETYDADAGRWIPTPRPEFDENLEEVIALVNDFVTERTTLRHEHDDAEQMSLVDDSEEVKEPSVRVDKAFLMQQSRALFLERNGMSEDDLADCTPSEQVEFRRNIMVIYEQLLGEQKSKAADAANSYQSPFINDDAQELNEDSDVYRSAKAAYYEEQLAALEEKMETVVYDIQSVQAQMAAPSVTPQYKLSLQVRLKELEKERKQLSSSHDAYSKILSE